MEYMKKNNMKYTLLKQVPFLWWVVQGLLLLTSIEIGSDPTFDIIAVTLIFCTIIMWLIRNYILRMLISILLVVYSFFSLWLVTVLILFFHHTNGITFYLWFIVPTINILLSIYQLYVYLIKGYSEM